MAAVPHELGAVARRRVARHPCALCPEPIGGARAVLGPCWVAHLACYRPAFDKARRDVPALAAHGREEAHALFRAVITQRVAAAQIAAGLGRPGLHLNGGTA